VTGGSWHDGAVRRWHSHAWNTETSLSLIRGIIPKVPRWLVPAIAVPTTALCFAYMRNERRAARKNLTRIGIQGMKLHGATWRLFYNFSKFMVSYCELGDLTAEEVRSRASHAGPDLDRIARGISGGRGVIVLTAHLGNWEAGLRLLEGAGAPVNVAMRIDHANPVEARLVTLRQSRSIHVIPVGDDPSSVLALRAALGRNEILAVQGDRPSGSRSLFAPVFGAPLPLPIGPFLLAYLTGAPLLPAFFLQEGWWRFRSEIHEAIAFPRTGDRNADLAAGAASYGAVLEGMLRRHPDQWFCFYDAWQPPDGDTGAWTAAAG
jgi:predicted LPLAT superfamily acyltransferase